MADGIEWQRSDAQSRIAEILDAAKVSGTQKIVDVDGSFNVTFVPRKQSLEKLFSKPGPIEDDD